MATKVSVEEPSRGGAIGAFIFWAIAGTLSLITIALRQLPGWEWIARVLVFLIAAGIVFASLKRASDRRRRGIPDNPPGIFDPWTIVHTTAGFFMGVWGVPLPLVAIFTVGWEIFEYLVPGFGDNELVANRAMDVIVAWVGWAIAAGAIALITNTPMPLLLPASQSLVRDAGLHLF